MKLPELIHGYRVLKHIGSGAASEIFCVFDPKTSQVFALKQVILDEKRDKDAATPGTTILNTKFFLLPSKIRRRPTLLG